MDRKYSNTIWLAILWAIFTAILVFLFYYASNRNFDVDEIEHLHTGWKILQGQQIFVDFFQHHHPFLHYLLAYIITIFGETTDTIFAGRYVMALMMVGILTVTYLLSIRIFKSAEIGIISMILTVTVVSFYMKSIEVRPDVPQALTGLLSIYFLFTFYDKKSTSSLIASAVFLAVSYLFLQKTIILILIIGLFLLYDLIRKRIGFREVLIYAGTFLICISPYYLYLLISGSYKEYFVMNWLINLSYPQEVRISTFIGQTLRENFITGALYFLGIIKLVRMDNQRRFVLLSLSLFISILILMIPWRQYFIMVIPLIAIIASYTIYSISKNKLVRIIVLIAAIFIPIFVVHNGLFKMNNKKQSVQIDRINYVLSITNENDKIYDPRCLFNLYREDIDYFWFCTGKNTCLDIYRKLNGYEYDIYDLIAKEKPKVVSTLYINDLNNENIRNNYEASDYYDDILIRKD